MRAQRDELRLLLLRPLPEDEADDERLLPDDEERLLPRALARSLWARLFCVLARPPLLAAWARLERPDEDDLEEEEEDELRDAMACSLVGFYGRPPPDRAAATRSI
jgi:hypothetical protein